MSTAVAFEDTPAWEAGLRVHEAENKWLLREFLAVLGASKSYARSLSGGGVDLGLGDGLGGVLGALAGAGAGALAAGMEGIGLGDGAGADGSDGAVRVGVSAEANFAAALERVGTVAAGTAEEEEMAAPMAAAIGAPLLAPIADALRAVGMLRESLGRRVRENLVDNLQCFVDEDLGAFATMRDRYERDRAACDAARQHHLAQSPARPAAQAQAAKDLAAAKEALEASRARVALAQTALEGRRRYVLLEAARETVVSLRRFFEDAGAAMRAVDRDLAALEEYEMASRAQAEMKMESAARTLQEAFDGLATDPFGVDPPFGANPPPPSDDRSAGGGSFSSPGGGDASRGAPDVGDETTTPDPPAGAGALENERPPPLGSGSASAGHSGRSGDAAIRASLASARDSSLASASAGSLGVRRLGVGAIRRGYLAEKNPGKFGGWSRRFFVLDGAGRFLVHGRRKARARGAAAEGGAGPEGGGAGFDARSGSDAAVPEAAGPSEAEEAARSSDSVSVSVSGGGPPGGLLRGIGAGIGAAWSFVNRAAAPEPTSLDVADDAVPAVDLTVSCVKPGAEDGASRAGGRPFCFRVISPAASLTLQAESEAEAAAWIADLQGVIAELISMGPERNPSFRELDARGDPPGANDQGDDARETTKAARGESSLVAGGPGPASPAPPGPTSLSRVLRDTSAPSALDVRAELGAAPGNDKCADCDAPNPDWASLNLLVVICQRCAGAHRHLGAHVSKVRSLALDRDAWTPPVRTLFLALGNTAANDVWEAKRRAGTVAPKILRLEAAISERGADGDAVGVSGVEPEHPPPVASPVSLLRAAPGANPDAAAAFAAIEEKYKKRKHVQPATVATPSLAEAAGKLDLLGVLRRVACASDDPRDAENVARTKREGLLAAIRRGEEGAATAALLLMNGARAEGGAGGDDDESAVEAAAAAGCALEGDVVGLLRAHAEARGETFDVERLFLPSDSAPTKSGDADGGEAEHGEDATRVGNDGAEVEPDAAADEEADEWLATE